MPRRARMNVPVRQLDSAYNRGLMTLASGTRLGPYEIAESAGAGGMGDVYRAHDTRLDRDVAVKTIKGSVHRALRTGSARDLRAESSEHLHALRRRSARRQRLPGDGVHRREADCRTAAGGAGDCLRHPDLRCPPRRASQGHRPSRPEAGQHSADETGREAARFRPGQAFRERQLRRDVRQWRACWRAGDGGGADRGTHRGRHPPVHGSRTDRGSRGRRADRHLCVRLRALRAADRAASVRRKDAVSGDGRDPGHQAAPDRGARAADAAGARADCVAVPREGPGRSVADRARRRRGAAVGVAGWIESRSARGRHGPSSRPRRRRVGGVRGDLVDRHRVRCRLGASRAGAAGAHSLSAGDAERSVEPEPARGITRWPEDRVCRRRRWQATDLDPRARVARRASAAGHRWRAAPVLVARQPVPRVLCRRQVEESRHFGWSAADDLRCAERRRWIVESRRRDSLRRAGQRSDLARGRRRRRGQSRSRRQREGRRVWRRAGPSSCPMANASSTWSSAKTRKTRC